MSMIEDIIEILEFIAIPLAIGFIIGLSFAYVHVANIMDNQVCGDVCLDSDDFYRMFEKWKESDTMMIQCIRGIEWLDDEFNLTLLIGEDDMLYFSNKYQKRFEKIRKDQNEYFDILEGVYVE